MFEDARTLLDRLIAINFSDDANIGSLISREDWRELTEDQSATLEEVRSCLQATLKTLQVARAAFAE